MKLDLKVVPKSSRDCIAGWLGDALKVRVRAPAERGKANAAVEGNDLMRWIRSQVPS